MDEQKLINASVRIPGSKSLSHRAAIVAALARGKSELRDFLKSEDTLYTTRALLQLGVDLSLEGETLKVEGTGGKLEPRTAGKEIYVGNSGTSLRLLLAVAGLTRGDIVLTGSLRMRERPVGNLVDALRQLHVDVTCTGKDGYPPVLIRGRGIRGGKTTVVASKSSQFISSLLLCAPYAEKNVEIKVIGKPVSLPYIDLTLDVMKRFGISVDHDGYGYFRIKAGDQYRGRNMTIEGDASSASYFWAAAAVTCGTVVTENIYPRDTRQGDIRFLELLEEMGCLVQRDIDRVAVRGAPLTAIEVDMGNMPDMVPTLAAISLFAGGKTCIRNVGHLRHKESDRLRVIAVEWKKLGGRVEELPYGIVIHGGYPLEPALVDPHNDHRLAMAFAVVGLRVPGIVIKDRECVNKSFPGFWTLWKDLREDN